MPVRFLALALAVLSACPSLLFAEGAARNASFSPAVTSVLDAAFASDEPDEIVGVLVAGAGKQAEPGDRRRILAVLASYEERLGQPASAAKHFSEAAWADPSARDDALMLEAARCYLCSGDAAQADSIVRSVLLSCFDESTLIRARLYSAWLSLSGDSRAQAIELFRGYTGNPAYRDYLPQILFTLWWAESDKGAADRLLSSWPGTPEAAVVRGDILLSPSAFWYLMERNGIEGFVPSAPAAKAGGSGDAASAGGSGDAGPLADGSGDSSASTADFAGSAEYPAGETSFRQVGFFRTREYAEDLVQKLKEKGFNPVVQSETRPSGTVYYAVLVAENGDRTTGDRLKDAGFENYLRVR